VFFVISIIANEYESIFTNNLKTLLKDVSKSDMIGIIYISIDDLSTAQNISYDLEYSLGELGYNTVSHDWQEFLPYFEDNYGWKYQLNTMMNDDSVYDISNFIRIDIAIVGRIIERENNRRLNLRVLDIKTKKIIGSVTYDI